LLPSPLSPTLSPVPGEREPLPTLLLQRAQK
jgi:hypothetical protein